VGIFRTFIPYAIPDWRRPWALAQLGDALRLVHRIRRQGYDALAYLAPSLRSHGQRLRDRTFFALGGIPRYCSDPAWAPRRGCCHEATALRLAVGRARGPASLELRITTDERVEASRLLSRPSPGTTLIVIAPFAAQPANRWPLPRFVAVCQDLAQERACRLLVVGGPGDRETAASLVDALPAGMADNLCGRLSPRQTVALMQGADAFVGCDSGPIHLAACAGLPSVGIYGARNPPNQWRPLNPRAIIHRLETDCAGCGLRACPRPDHPCLTGIPPAAVTASLRRLLAIIPEAP
jgi:ADP-heptose:LPS heptosyltransferase